MGVHLTYMGSEREFVAPGEGLYMELVCDGEGDVGSLPTTEPYEESGMSYGLPAVGSFAGIIASGARYMLGTDRVWRRIGG